VTVIAKIAEIPPQQAKGGLAGDPGLPKIAKIEGQNLTADDTACTDFH